MFSGITGWHALIIVAVVLLLFGAPKLPGLARSIGQSMHILKKEVGSPESSAIVPAEPGAEPRAGAKTTP